MDRKLQTAFVFSSSENINLKKIPHFLAKVLKDASYLFQICYGGQIYKVIIHFQKQI